MKTLYLVKVKRVNDEEYIPKVIGPRSVILPKVNTFLADGYMVNIRPF